MFTLKTSKVDYRVFSISKGYPDHFHWLWIFYTLFWGMFFDKNEILQRCKSGLRCPTETYNSSSESLKYLFFGKLNKNVRIWVSKSL